MNCVIVTEADREWLREGQRRRWDLPPQPRAFWCWFGIRHSRAALRAATAYLKFDPDAPDWAKLWHEGWIAHAIWRGWC